MINEILIIILSIIVLSTFLLIFKSWHLHVSFKNHNSHKNFQIKINFLILQIIINSINQLILNIIIKNHIIHLFNFNLNSDNLNNDVNNDEDDMDDIEEITLFKTIKTITPILIDSKEDLYQIIILIKKMFTFQDSKILLNIGLKDNNLTIKLCNLLWSLFAPLYPLHLQVFITPEINTLIIKSNMDIQIDLKLVNLVRILFVILRSKNLNRIIKFLR